MAQEKAAHKKWWIALGAAVLLTVILILSFILRPKTALDLDDVSSFLLKTDAYSQGMQELDPAELETRWGLSSSGFSEGKAFAASDGTAREILLLNTVDKKAADKAVTTLILYCQDLADRYDTENPDEAARVRACQIRRTRNYVFLLIGDGTADVSFALEDYLDRVRYDKYQ